MSGVLIRKADSGEKSVLEAKGLFYGIGHSPNSQLLEGQVDLDSSGYVLVEEGSAKTSVEGVFAAGDVQVNMASFYDILLSQFCVTCDTFSVSSFLHPPSETRGWGREPHNLPTGGWTFGHRDGSGLVAKPEPTPFACTFVPGPILCNYICTIGYFKEKNNYICCGSMGLFHGKQKPL